jgi:hypothetical protein
LVYQSLLLAKEKKLLWLFVAFWFFFTKSYIYTRKWTWHIFMFFAWFFRSSNIRLRTAIRTSVRIKYKCREIYWSLSTWSFCFRRRQSYPEMTKYSGRRMLRLEVVSLYGSTLTSRLDWKINISLPYSLFNVSSSLVIDSFIT